MAIQTFPWRLERDIDPTFKYRVNEAKFGDGYTQRSTDGINTRDESWSIKMHGNGKRTKEVMDFFDAHAGWKSFFWTPPLGTLGLYVASDPKYDAQGGDVWTVTATFTKVYAAIPTT